jgi:hypothetical protein
MTSGIYRSNLNLSSGGPAAGGAVEKIRIDILGTPKLPRLSILYFCNPGGNPRSIIHAAPGSDLVPFAIVAMDTEGVRKSKELALILFQAALFLHRLVHRIGDALLPNKQPARSVFALPLHEFNATNGTL